MGGILTELDAEMDMVKFMIIGIGINVNSDKSSLPAKSTSLKQELKESVSRVDLVKEILRKLESKYCLFQREGFHPIAEEWRNLSTTLNKRVRVSCQKEHIEGEAIDIDMDGGLLIRKDSGFTEKVLAGDVTYCK